MFERLKARVAKSWSTTSLKVLNTFLPEAEPGSWSDLKREELEGRVMRGGQVAPPLELAVDQPVFRRDGQIHNFDAVPHPHAPGRKFGRAQYNVRYGGSRPQPRNSVLNFAKDPT